MKNLLRSAQIACTMCCLAACAAPQEGGSRNVPQEYAAMSNRDLIEAASNEARSRRGSYAEARGWARIELQNRKTGWNWEAIEAGDVVVGMTDAEVLLAAGKPRVVESGQIHRWQYRSYSVVFERKRVVEVAAAED